ncbi:MAG: ATP-binding protein [Terriglobia bacterium]
MNNVVEDSAPEWISADQGRLRQVLVSLLGNAIKFTSRGAVTLQVSHAANQLKVAASDTGIGIPPEKQSIIFEAFQQADNSTSRRYGGTGIRLTISKKLVESMGGQLLLASEPSKGSTFWFTSEAPPASAPPPNAQPLAELPPPAPVRILVA